MFYLSDIPYIIIIVIGSYLIIKKPEFMFEKEEEK